MDSGPAPSGASRNDGEGRSPDGAQRNPGIVTRARPAPDFAALHPGYSSSALRSRTEGARPDLGNLALEGGLPRIRHGGGTRLGHRAGEVRQDQRAVEDWLDQPVDDCMPVGKALTIGIAVALNHGCRPHDLERRRRLPGQAAVDHVQPAFDPGPLDGIAYREQPPSPQGGLDLQAANAPATSDAKADPDWPVRPPQPFQHIEDGLRGRGGERSDQFVKPEFWRPRRRSPAADRRRRLRQA